MDNTNIKQLVVDSLKVLVENNHTIKQKKEIKIFSDRVAIACVLCGDSEKIPSKKRGNLYLKSLRYKCFNCGESQTFLSLLRTHNINLDFDEKNKIADYVEENISNTKWDDDDFVCKNLDKLIPIDTLSNYFNNNENSKITDFRPVTKGSKVYKYLNDRKIFNHDDIYEGTYWHTPTWCDTVLINMNQAHDKVLGIQLRNLKNEKGKRFYKIIPFSEIYRWVYNGLLELDEIEMVGYDKISYLYNILKVDWSRPITIFEGFLDTKFFPNAIGCVGTNTDVGFIINQGVDIRFFYDYDKAGIKKTKEMIKNGQKVFLWDKLFEKWATTSKNPYSAYIKLTNNIVDLNDTAKLVLDPYKKLNLENYFSLDQMDILFIKDKL